jgi:hypothetical protein
LQSRQRTWIRDEVVLAMELYLRDGVVSLGACRPLSLELRGVPIEGELAADPSFRNAQAVRSKLYNLQWLDTEGAHGRANAGMQTVVVWEQFGRDRERIEREASAIRRELRDAGSERGMGWDGYEAEEGSVRVVAHRRRERDLSFGVASESRSFAALGRWHARHAALTPRSDGGLRGSSSAITSYQSVSFHQGRKRNSRTFACFAPTAIDLSTQAASGLPGSSCSRSFAASSRASMPNCRLFRRFSSRFRTEREDEHPGRLSGAPIASFDGVQQVVDSGK